MSLIRKIFMAINLVCISYLTYTILLYPMVYSSTVDEELKPYVSTYFVHLKSHCPEEVYNVHHDIVFSDKGDDRWVGVCKTYVNRVVIEIDRVWFYGSSEKEKEQLIFHEMAHCFIEKEHVEDSSNYMYPYMVSLPRPLYTQQAIDDIKDYCK